MRTCSEYDHLMIIKHITKIPTNINGHLTTYNNTQTQEKPLLPCAMCHVLTPNPLAWCTVKEILTKIAVVQSGSNNSSDASQLLADDNPDTACVCYVYACTKTREADLTAFWKAHSAADAPTSTAAPTTATATATATATTPTVTTATTTSTAAKS